MPPVILALIVVAIIALAAYFLTRPKKCTTNANCSASQVCGSGGTCIAQSASQQAAAQTAAAAQAQQAAALAASQAAAAQAATATTAAQAAAAAAAQQAAAVATAAAAAAAAAAAQTTAAAGVSVPWPTTPTLTYGGYAGTYTCPGSTTPGACVLPTVAAAQAMCQSDPACTGYFTTSNANWIKGAGGMALLSNAPPNVNSSGPPTAAVWWAKPAGM